MGKSASSLITKNISEHTQKGIEVNKANWRATSTRLREASRSGEGSPEGRVCQLGCGIPRFSRPEAPVPKLRPHPPLRRAVQADGFAAALFTHPPTALPTPSRAPSDGRCQAPVVWYLLPPQPQAGPKHKAEVRTEEGVMGLVGWGSLQPGWGPLPLPLCNTSSLSGSSCCAP